MTDFNIRELIREVAKVNDSTDAVMIADKVAPLVPESELRDVLAQALRGVVRDMLNEHRPRGQINHVEVRPAPVLQARPVPPTQFVQPAPSPAVSQPTFSRMSSPAPRPTLAPVAASSAPRPAPAPAPVPRTIVTQQPAHRVQTVGGRKGGEIREAWQRVLEAPYATEHGHKKLGDFTYEDCQYVAAQLDRQADQLASRGRGIRSLGALLMDHDVLTIRDLPAEVKMQALGAKA